MQNPQDNNLTSFPPCKCGCGETFTSRFCPNCGAQRKEEKTFTCDCGYTGPLSNFCPECGKKITDNAAPAVPVQETDASAVPAGSEVNLGWKCPQCGAADQDGKCTACGAEIKPEILFSLSTFASCNPPVTTYATVYEYSDTQLLFDNNGNRRLISSDVIEPAMEIIRKHKLNDPDSKDKASAGIMGGSFYVGFKDGDKYMVTSLQDYGFVVQTAHYELMGLFNNA